MEHEGVAVLPEHVAVLVEYLRQRELGGLARVGLFSDLVLHESEVGLRAEGRADVTGGGLDACQAFQLGYVMAFGEDVDPFHELRGHGLADGEARVRGRVDQQHLGAVLGQDGTGDGAGEARAEDDDVEGHVLGCARRFRRAVGLLGDHDCLLRRGAVRNGKSA